VVKDFVLKGHGFAMPSLPQKERGFTGCGKGESARKFPQRLEPHDSISLMARLKSYPFKKANFFAACFVVPLREVFFAAC